MLSAYYSIIVVLSLLLLLGYLSIWHKHLDVHITIIFILAPIANLGYAFVAHSHSLEAALVATKMHYVAGCFIMVLLMFATYGLCGMPLGRKIRMSLLTLSMLEYACVLTIGTSPLYYATTALVQRGGVSILQKTYGPAHTLFIVTEVAYFLASIGVVAYSYVRRRHQVSRRLLGLLTMCEFVGLVCFFGGRKAFPDIELLPVAYDFSLTVFLIISYRISLFDVTDSAIDSIVQTATTGFVSIDERQNYLGCTPVALSALPELAEFTVDSPLPSEEGLGAVIAGWIAASEADPPETMFTYDRGDRFFRVQVQPLFSGGRRHGYQLLVSDDTDQQRYIALLNSFNDELQREVDAQVAHVREMHASLVMGMATMVESRDNSTGGHIRRTSEGVRLLIDEMREDAESPELTEDFCKKVVKAAPMHDLGKIAVDDAVLRKPGRFTPEEFEKMKTHAAEGARIVAEVLKGTDDEQFRRIAVNVAHYHHERWDGSGYPDGLAGDQIPLEARIMAIADVYDALVSKRVYKEAMSFGEADAIILDGMDSQFDGDLERYYVRARPHLESYYRSLDQQSQ